MESTMLWGVGIIFYLVIGWGYYSFANLEENYLDWMSHPEWHKKLVIFIWPYAIGFTLGQVKKYYAEELDLARCQDIQAMRANIYNISLQAELMAHDIDKIKDTLIKIKDSQKD